MRWRGVYMMLRIRSNLLLLLDARFLSFKSVVIFLLQLLLNRFI
ncbi:hypothetical protein U14_00501 [Candidatus Moduliflexus flocculans]|uniref:Uncharacterized protein n=1 Tax=Candidatus Moduliflexus flocculans TaxID=1499966 RepID=A0A0S6VQD8_9BACT|nr:hypothetical protein U14_00501 [Candidatus Moduliflexus flocculans]